MVAWVCVFTQVEAPAGRVQILFSAGLYLRLFTNELYTTGIMTGGINWLDCGTVIVIKKLCECTGSCLLLHHLQIAESTGFSSVLLGPLNTSEV